MSRAERRTAFVLDGTKVRPGTTAHIDVPLARLPTGTWMHLPVIVVHGKRPGPTVWVDGAIHGDELNGVAVVRELVGALDANALAGTLLAVPIVNVFGIMEGSRTLPDGRDLNRSFPGSARGSLAARLAHTFLDRVALKCTLGVDIHTGSKGRENLPQLRCDLDDPDAQRFARAFAAPITLHAKVRDGSLRASARKHGIPVLVYEVGEALRLSPSGIAAGVEGIRRVLAAAEMLPAPPAPPPPSLVSRRTSWIRARRSGLCSSHVRLGQRVRAGEPVATVSDGIGQEQSVVRARFDGLVIAVAHRALVYRGDALIHLAEIAT